VEQKGAGLINSFIEGVKELEKEGVKAITASCGFTVLSQEELAAAVNIPVFTSSVLQISLAHKIMLYATLISFIRVAIERWV